ncbi:LytR/AlgR family response regulator transcription factor [Paraflavitalea pollutisoli]|uniref:LytR/AlgR family response regulator transcription factor n=1 Tax=Paraflavitalea pollutisoli TaxID=3034143 RepID=UPI0023EE029C|nr:LytTR family DNA-binding domain-containing protein [Paraflavitalea sp. H1-2-19X]
MSSTLSSSSTLSPLQPVTIRQDDQAIVAPLFREKETAPAQQGLAAQLQDLLQLLSPARPAGPEYRSRFLIRKGHQFISLPVADIRYFYSREKICFVKTADNKDYVVPHTITEIESMVSPVMFFRASRKYIITHAAISRILIWFNGKLKVEILAGQEEDIVISRERVNNFKLWLGE